MSSSKEKISTTNKAVFGSIDAFEAVLGNEKILSKDAYWIARLADKVRSEHKIIVKLVQNLNKKYAVEQTKEEKEKGKLIIPHKNRDKHEKEFDELMDIPVEIDQGKISFDVIPSGEEDGNIKGVHLLALMDFITEPSK